MRSSASRCGECRRRSHRSERHESHDDGENGRLQVGRQQAAYFGCKPAVRNRAVTAVGSAAEDGGAASDVEERLTAQAEPHGRAWMAATNNMSGFSDASVRSSPEKHKKPKDWPAGSATRVPTSRSE
ncbi:hypothetical protein VCV18_006763 [Metarhizium anisopliae]